MQNPVLPSLHRARPLRTIGRNPVLGLGKQHPVTQEPTLMQSKRQTDVETMAAFLTVRSAATVATG
jgi:hypothetical protein